MLREIIRFGESAKEKLYGKVVGFQAVCTGKVETSNILPFVGDVPLSGGCDWKGKAHKVEGTLAAEQALGLANEDGRVHRSDTGSASFSDFGPGGEDYHRVKIITLREERT